MNANLSAPPPYGGGRRGGEALNIRNTHNIRKYPRSRYTRTGSVSLYHHRIFLITCRGQQDDVIAAFQTVKRMVSADFLQADRCFAVFQLGYETPMLVLGFQHLATGLEIGIEARHFLPEVIQGAFKEVIGHKEVLLNIALFQTVTGLACQNHQFADNILSAEVDTRIGFGVTFLLCLI